MVIKKKYMLYKHKCSPCSVLRCAFMTSCNTLKRSKLDAHLVRSVRLRFWVCWVLAGCSCMSRVQCRFRLWNEKRFRLGLLDGHTCSDSACSDSGSAVGSGFRSLMGSGTGCGFGAEMWRSGEGLVRISEAGGSLEWWQNDESGLGRLWLSGDVLLHHRVNWEHKLRELMSNSGNK